MNRELNSGSKRFQRFHIYKRGVYSLLQIHFFREHANSIEKKVQDKTFFTDFTFVKKEFTCYSREI